MEMHGNKLMSDDPTDPYYGQEIVAPNYLVPGNIPRWGAGTRTKLAAVDHILPYTKGGSSSYCNARVITQRQNSQKGNSTEGNQE
jgi:hypothetical protein